MTTDREDFEHAYEPNPHKSPFTQVQFDEEAQVYKPLDKYLPRIASALNSAWYGWRIRQSKIGELQLRNQMLSDNVKEMGDAHIRDTDLINQQAAMLEELRMLVWFVKDHFDMNDLDKAMPRVYEKLKDATTNIIKSNHNTSCTYQFELAFHNLQDTPELRKIYWSALGQLRFDSNDRVIPPELEECPCCKGNQDA
ncbi:hypothetical protein [Acinetobacter baumannii]|uniref:Uncharacterized protein n=1 Tax=Acinetobacter baumannii TaxID=470 RepID=A0AA44XPP5_ACIBA|nr:hypothetical protein [Acinetobacter baumannii]EKA73372.1 hypothetical protein ACINWC692_1319 [Acinetobacter baumannii WC-692]PQL82435.1 hypothetical protein CV954_012730 [Acinetobacter baumannii]